MTLAVVSELTDGPTGVWLGDPARERVVISSVRGSCGIQVRGLPLWSQVPKPPRHSAGAAKRNLSSERTIPRKSLPKSLQGILLDLQNYWTDVTKF
jgi:hypothetical protein